MPNRSGSRGRKKASLHALSREGIGPEHQEAYAKELMGESDRAAALVAAADVDFSLGLLVQSKFNYKLTDEERHNLLYGKRAPLSDFASRISVSYAFGFIRTDERDDLDRIRHIRNAFAHTLIPLTFKHDLVARECARLAYRNVHADMADTLGQPKLRYIVTAIELRDTFAQRVLTGARGYAKTIKDRALRKQYLDRIEGILKPDT